ncbi:hypothetical protein HYY75_13115 [bacterium]|nr:hypothetical protein [bacterium]
MFPIRKSDTISSLENLIEKPKLSQTGDTNQFAVTPWWYFSLAILSAIPLLVSNEICSEIENKRYSWGLLPFDLFTLKNLHQFGTIIVTILFLVFVLSFVLKEIRRSAYAKPVTMATFLFWIFYASWASLVLVLRFQ